MNGQQEKKDVEVQEVYIPNENAMAAANVHVARIRLQSHQGDDHEQRLGTIGAYHNIISEQQQRWRCPRTPGEMKG